ncbi:MAG: hypothetical protein ROM54_01940 [Anaerobiospirillum sp.]|nr:hypothetical protein [Anaerobiospirillum sp.]
MQKIELALLEVLEPIDIGILKLRTTKRPNRKVTLYQQILGILR